MKIGFITSTPDVLKGYFPTAMEPDFLPTEPPFTPDDQILVNRLRADGMVVEPVVWETPVSQLTGFDLLVVRSPWDYMANDTNRAAFIKWLYLLEEHDIPLENSIKMILWLVDKHYLRDFSSVGIATVPTHYVEVGETCDLRQMFQTQGKLIIKPCVSAAGRGLVFIQNEAEAQQFQSEFDQLSQAKAYMIQPFIPEIQTNGEWSLVFLDGLYSHAVHKYPAEGKILVQAEQGGGLAFKNPPTGIQDFGRQVMSKMSPALAQKYPEYSLQHPPLYMRIDIIDTQSGPRMQECEGVEPELFIRACPGSETVFCKAVQTRIQWRKNLIPRQFQPVL